jgi:hypothetical protein
MSTSFYIDFPERDMRTLEGWAPLGEYEWGINDEELLKCRVSLGDLGWEIKGYS